MFSVFRTDLKKGRNNTMQNFRDQVKDIQNYWANIKTQWLNRSNKKKKKV